MNSGRPRSALSYIPGLKNNAVLQLIIFSAGAYMMLAISWAVIMLVYKSNENFDLYFLPNIALPALAGFKTHWWTLLTYGWFQVPNSFMEMASNMLWLYCFGSVVQMLVGYKQVVPLYAYSMVTGGVFYLVAQLLPGSWGVPPNVIGLLGPRAGLIGMAAAAITLTPKYRFYLTETFSIHILVVGGVFALLMIMSSGFFLPVIALLAGGGLMGFVYVKLLQSGYRPGEWMYKLSWKIESLVTPNEDEIRRKNSKKRNEILNRAYYTKMGISQKRIDDILDKINQKGYNSLTQEEKDILLRAGKEGE